MKMIKRNVCILPYKWTGLDRNLDRNLDGNLDRNLDGSGQEPGQKSRQLWMGI